TGRRADGSQPNWPTSISGLPPVDDKARSFNTRLYSETHAVPEFIALLVLLLSFRAVRSRACAARTREETALLIFPANCLVTGNVKRENCLSPLGAFSFSTCTRGLRRAVHSCATSRLKEGCLQECRTTYIHRSELQ